MKTLYYCGLIIGLLALRAKPEMAPKAPFTGMTNISWVGFGNQSVSSVIPLGVTNMSTPTPFVYPKKIQNQIAFYQEILLVNSTFKPASPAKQSPVFGNWFVRRQVLIVKDGKTQVVQLTKLSINKNAEATSAVDQPIPFSATHIEYQLGRTEKILAKPQPGKLPTTKTVEVYPNDAVRIAAPVAEIMANTCEVKKGVVRPLPCEFQLVKFQIIGKSGKTVYETSSVENGAKIQIPNGESKKTDGQFFYYDAKLIVKRIHKPNFTPQKGYMVNWGQTGSDFNAEIDTHSSLVSGLQLDATIGKEFTIPVEIKNSTPNSGFIIKTGELLLENDVTRSKFPTTQMPGATRADAYIRLSW
ncbi:hypothetical protein [Larkinella terrae]|uniref:Uncharacterized protein n=1 Tax=Larkinella terrae TaxID=2025311 RepID=A0A7K0EKM2_9BACT|nr:hypothetical protein [Larkinella terrae]MRS62081.1 hypothetical protein [Larkinella terrae]